MRSSCSFLLPQLLNVDTQARLQCPRQPTQCVALRLRQVGSLSLCKHGQEEHWNILAAVIGDHPVAAALAMAVLGDAKLPAAARSGQDLAGFWIFSQKDDHELTLLLGHAGLA